MPLPGRQSKKKSLFSFLNPGERGGDVGAQEFHDIEQAEHNLRQRSAAETPAAPPAEIVAAQQPAQRKDIPKPPVTQQRDWHKKSDWYDTVTPRNRITVDPDGDPSAYHTITDAMNYAKSIQTALALIYIDPIQLIEVHGGQYDEQIVVDVNYLRFQGIGKPVITSVKTYFNDGIISIAPACTRVIFDNFEIVTTTEEILFLMGANWNDWVGIRIFEGAESGKFISDIQFLNCYIHGPGTQIYSERWSYFENVKTYSSDNWDNGGDVHTSPPLFPSVVCRFCYGDGGSTLQKKWTKFVRCTLSGQNDTNDPIKKGVAFWIMALKSDLTTWISNAETHMTVGADFATHGIYTQTGVLFQECELIGGGYNYGWAIEEQNPKNIGGVFFNDTGSGMVHLVMATRTHIADGDPDVSAYAWIHGGVTKSNYLIAYIELNNPGGTIATANAWVKHHEHTYPTFNNGGSAMHNLGGGIGHLYVVDSTTSEQFWLAAGAATVNVNSVSNYQRIAAREGYMDV